MRRTKAVDKFLTKFDKELKSGMISLILLYMIEQSKESMYGYQIIKEIKNRTDGSLDFKEGTIYPILRNLEAQGLLRSAWDTRGERPRKYYHITNDGKSALWEAVKDWGTFSGIIGNLIMGNMGGESKGEDGNGEGDKGEQGEKKRNAELNDNNEPNDSGGSRTAGEGK